MFNVGDEVEVCVDLPALYPITREGSRGTVLRGERYGVVYVDFHTIEGPWKTRTDYTVHRYEISTNHLKLADGKSYTAIERKIRSIYARQGRRTKLPCFC